ncbi:MAG: hypothetical protein WC083_08055 [Candidatus Methanomethylophilaceae archaeon]|jgi:hypothetical protein
MRAWEIAKFLIIIQATIGLMNGMGYFGDSGTYFPTQNDSTTQYTVGDISEFNPATSGGVTQMGYFDMAVTFVMAGLNLVLKVIESIIFIFPTLVNTFGVPIPLAAILQIVIHMEVLYGVAQWKSGRSGRSID